MERQVRPVDAGTGARTFALYSLWGAGSAFLADRFDAAALLAGLLAMTALIVVRYFWDVKTSGDSGITTELAAFVTFGVGVLAFDSQYVVATALAIGLAALLRSRGFIHELSERFSDDDVVAVLQFAVITLVVLPLAPNIPLGPFEAINPRQIWLMVVFVSGIGLLGYLALRALGPRGLGVSGILGGLVSSTAVTLGFSRFSRAEPRFQLALVAGVIGASGLMYPRVLGEALVVASPLAAQLAVPLLVLGAAVVGMAVVWIRREGKAAKKDTDHPDQPVEIRNPLNLATAIQFGLLYGFIVLISKAVLATFSEESLLLVAALSGLNDVDAITLSTANLVAEGTLGASVGAQAVLLAVAVNTLVKAGIVWFVGSRFLARQVARVLVPAAAVAALWVLFL